jgi:hypothetical protein
MHFLRQLSALLFEARENIVEAFTVSDIKFLLKAHLLHTSVRTIIFSLRTST